MIPGEPRKGEQKLWGFYALGFKPRGFISIMKVLGFYAQVSRVTTATRFLGDLSASLIRGVPIKVLLFIQHQLTSSDIAR